MFNNIYYLVLTENPYDKCVNRFMLFLQEN